MVGWSDGFDDNVEIQGGSDPNNASSTPALVIPQFTLLQAAFALLTLMAIGYGKLRHAGR